MGGIASTTSTISTGTKYWNEPVGTSPGIVVDAWIFGDSQITSRTTNPRLGTARSPLASPATPSSDATDTRLTFDTAATRSPAPITGTAMGSSTANSRCRLVYPIADAAESVVADTDASPSATTRTSKATVYTVNATATLTGSSVLVPSKPGRTTNNTSDGIV